MKKLSIVSLTHLNAFAEKNSYFVDERHVFLDNGVSGSKLQRPALDELREVIRFETFETIFFYNPDRLSRNYTHQLILMEEISEIWRKAIFSKKSSNK